MNNIFEIGPEVLEFLHNETGQIFRAFAADPEVESKAHAELSTADGREMLRTAISQGDMLIEVTADQITACRKTLLSPVLTIAPWTCARSASESSALGCWLMDPTSS